MIIQRHSAFIFSACIATALVVGPLSASAGAHLVSNTVTVDQVGRVASDGAITLTGTYRCSSQRLGPVLIGSQAVQGDTRTHLDGVVATCDGKERTWRATGQGSAILRPGAARSEATLLHLDFSNGLVPFPAVLASDTGSLTLQQS
ncbi:DUF6299 family protein [Streptomyces sp. NPDC005963]|uniref:DUF6299 family protein n=1 Tax=Streptomyces sp. NPDC005963 TaxID=3156721 RepID=UPI0033E294CA